MPAQAQLTDTTDFTEDSYLRLAFGDIPRTTAQESPQQWNLVEYQRVTDDGASASGWSPGVFSLPAGFEFDSADCTCGNVTVHLLPDGQYQVDYPPSVPAGEYVIAFRAHSQYSTVSFLYAPENTPWTASFYLVDGQEIASSLDASVAGLPSTAENPGYEIWSYTATAGQDQGISAWFVAGHDAPGTVGMAGRGMAINPWLMLAVGALLGILLWAFLVSRGTVQAKGRKQMANTAAHVEAAAHDPPAVLEGKKRALLAALKEIEVAKMNNEMPNDVYDAVKADLKKQAVTVMRALESATAASDAKA
jgi:hypothetical protein